MTRNIFFQHIKYRKEKKGGGKNMAFTKAIEHKKEHRKIYRGSKAFDASCRNHGGCNWCLKNRIYKYDKKKEATRLKEEEFEQEI